METLNQYFPKMGILVYAPAKRDYAEYSIHVEIILRDFKNLHSFKILSTHIFETLKLEHVYFSIDPKPDEKQQLCFKFEEHSDIIQPLPIDFYEEQVDRPCNVGYSFFIECTEQIKKIELDKYKLLDMDLTLPNFRPDSSGPMDSLIKLF
jgi:hypothetical protein